MFPDWLQGAGWPTAGAILAAAVYVGVSKGYLRIGTGGHERARDALERRALAAQRLATSEELEHVGHGIRHLEAKPEQCEAALDDMRTRRAVLEERLKILGASE